MWCPNCQADVAAEVTADSQRVRCATCSTELHVGTPVRSGAKTEAARELLKRWANDDMFDPFGPLPGVGSAKHEAPSLDELGASISHSTTRPDDAKRHARQPPAEQRTERGVSRPVFHFENGHTAAAEGSPASARTPASIQSQPKQTAPAPAAAFQAPPFNPPAAPADPIGDEVQTAVQEDHGKSANWTAFWGQILAYLGVAALTVGTSLVLWGYFGGPAGYTPTGWLIATAGQMMLFLGIVTLVSGGMEQTTDEVARRIDRLGTRLLRIEQATRGSVPNGPHTPARTYAESAAHAQRTTERERQHA
jgi:hypothetical protein